MRRRLPLLALSAVCAGALALSASAAGPPTTTLQFMDITTSFSATSNAQVAKLGDTFTFHDTVYKWNGRKRGAAVGHVDVLGEALNASVTRVSAVATLPGGTLVIFGDTGAGNGSQLAVVGGTGSYAGARGELLVHGIAGPNSNKSAITIRLWQ